MIKRRLIGLIAIAFAIFYGCVKDLHDLGVSEATVFKGRVLEESEREPLANVRVTITNGTTDYTSTKTNNEGKFELTVNFNNCDAGCYLFLDAGSSGITKKISLKGIGRESYDYGEIFLYNKNDGAPSAPNGVSAEVSGSRIKVSWNSVSNANEYVVYRSYNSSSNYSVMGTTSNSLFYDDDPYENNYYKVKAKNSYGESSYSSYAYCHYSSGGGSVPSAPTGVSAIVSDSRIKVSWNSVSNADEYMVYWSNNGITYNYVVGTTSETFIYDEEPYEDNYYKVKAKNSYGESSFSSSVYCHYSAGGHVEGWLQYDDGNGVDALGFIDGGTLYWADMFPASMLSSYDGTSVTKVEAYLNMAGLYTLRLYSGGTSSPGTLIYQQNFNHNYSSFVWATMTLSNPVLLNTTQNLWVVISVTHSAGEFPAGICHDAGAPNGRWVSDGNEWANSINGIGYTWGMHTFVTNSVKGEIPMEIGQSSVINSSGGGSSIIPRIRKKEGN